MVRETGKQNVNKLPLLFSDALVNLRAIIVPEEI
jgi:hypothetical protein